MLRPRGQGETIEQNRARGGGLPPSSLWDFSVVCLLASLRVGLREHFYQIALTSHCANGLHHIPNEYVVAWEDFEI